MRTSRPIAAVLLAAGLAAAGAWPGVARADDGKDWFGRPDQPCEPKCHWQWWLGRKTAPNMDQQTLAAPDRPAAVPTAEGSRARIGPITTVGRLSRANERRSAKRAARSAAKPERPAPAAPSTAPRPDELADVAAFAMMGHPAADQSAAEHRPDGRVASSFANMALVVVRRPTALGEPAAGLAASAVEAAALGDLGRQLDDNGMPLSQAVFDRAEGLEQVAAGEVSALVVSRFEPRDALRVALAQHPELTTLPLGAAPEPRSAAPVGALRVRPQAEAESVGFQAVPEPSPAGEAPPAPRPSRTAAAFDGVEQAIAASDVTRP